MNIKKEKKLFFEWLENRLIHPLREKWNYEICWVELLDKVANGLSFELSPRFTWDRMPHTYNAGFTYPEV